MLSVMGDSFLNEKLRIKKESTHMEKVHYKKMVDALDAGYRMTTGEIPVRFSSVSDKTKKVFFGLLMISASLLICIPIALTTASKIDLSLEPKVKDGATVLTFMISFGFLCFLAFKIIANMKTFETNLCEAWKDHRDACFQSREYSEFEMKRSSLLIAIQNNQVNFPESLEALMSRDFLAIADILHFLSPRLVYEMRRVAGKILVRQKVMEENEVLSQAGIEELREKLRNLLSYGQEFCLLSRSTKLEEFFKTAITLKEDWDFFGAKPQELSVRES